MDFKSLLLLFLVSQLSDDDEASETPEPEVGSNEYMSALLERLVNNAEATPRVVVS